MQKEEKEKKSILEESSDIENISVKLDIEEENPGIGYEIVIGPGSN